MTPRDCEELERAWLLFRRRVNEAEEARAALEIQANQTRDYAARFKETLYSLSAARKSIWTALTEMDPELWEKYLRASRADEFGEMIEYLMENRR